MGNGFTLWLTGLPGSGKNRLALILKEKLAVRNVKSVVLDDKDLIEIFNPGIGSDKDEWALYTARTVFICDIIANLDCTALVTSASPYKEYRDDARAELGNFFEIYLPADPSSCREASEDKDFFAKVESVYEEPIYPDHRYETVDTSVKEAVDMILTRLEDMGLVEAAGEGVYSDEDEEKIRERLQGLGYIE